MPGGTIYKYHDDLDTDQIIASQYLLLPDIDEMKVHTFESLDPDFPEKGKGRGFCGGRRELWMRFLQGAGAKRAQGSGGEGRDCQIICQDFL